MKRPRDKTRYEQDPRSVPISADVADGLYVYVQDQRGVIWVLPDEGHAHPKVLGKVRSAKYAGDLTVQGGMIMDVTNLSGTFQFASKRGLRAVARQLGKQGLKLRPGAVRFFPTDGRRPIILE